MLVGRTVPQEPIPLALTLKESQSNGDVVFRLTDQTLLLTCDETPWKTPSYDCIHWDVAIRRVDSDSFCLRMTDTEDD